MNMHKYRRKPAIVEAIQFTGENASAIFMFTGFLPQSSRHAHSAAPAKSIEIQLMDSVWLVTPGDWIVRTEDSISVCKAATFAATYEPVDSVASAGVATENSP